VKNRGFTLIELMISMALFGLIAAGAMALVMSGARSQAHSSRVDTAQSSLRAGMDLITRDVMMASAGVVSGKITLSGVQRDAVDFSTGNNSTTGPDTLDAILVDGSVAAQASAGVAAGASTINFNYEQNTGTFSTTNKNVLLTDLTWGVIVPWTSASATALTLSSVVPALPAGNNFGTANGTYMMPARRVVYTVGSAFFTAANATQNTSTLNLAINGAAAQPLAEGIEDMQVAYGFDTDADGVVNEIGNAADDDDWLYNKAGDTIKATFTIANLRTIRVTLVAKTSATENGAVFGGAPPAEDRAAIPSDGFARRIMRTEIAVRNLHQ
jgi:type IV pilus assembly protein PilW